jgi:Histidine kinase-, DNA gyrase B-, and HSP90-like ATPase
MYVFPVTIYREYVQNAVDAIDAARSQGLFGVNERGKVSIQIDHACRMVAIRDNGCGIPSTEAVETLLAVGGSPKRGTGARGFRGVGRLSGLAYCRELEFLTKAAGDARAVSMVWDCRALRTRLADSTFRGDVRDIIASVATVWSGKAVDPTDHFLKFDYVMSCVIGKTCC